MYRTIATSLATRLVGVGAACSGGVGAADPTTAASVAEDHGSGSTDAAASLVDREVTESSGGPNPTLTWRPYVRAMHRADAISIDATSTAAVERPGTSDREPPVLDLVVPVHDEERTLEASVQRLLTYLARSSPFPYRITIADNASGDTTPAVAARLAAEHAEVRSVRLDQKGRGRALRAVWAASDAEVLVYMDVDLSTDLAALLPLVAPLLSGHSDIAIGTRLARGAHVVRGTKRELISRAYNVILRTALGAGFTDAQCGFKAIRRDVAMELLPDVEDTGWFFDTELLVLAERRGYRIHEVPVDWVDDPDSRVDIVATATADLRGVARLFRHAFDGQLIRFLGIGVLSTVAYSLLFVLLRPAVGSQAANLISLATTAVGNTALNRALTFGVRGQEGVIRHQAQGLAVFAAALALTSGSLALLHALWPTAPTWFVLGALAAANLLATVGRFVAFRQWIFVGTRAPRTEASTA